MEQDYAELDQTNVTGGDLAETCALSSSKWFRWKFRDLEQMKHIKHTL